MDSRPEERNLPKILKDKAMKREKNQREKLWEEAGGHCIYCGHPVTVEGMEIDHIEPLSLGGENSYENKVCSCPACNAAKGARKLEEFLAETMGKSKRKRLSNRVNHLAAQHKMSWSKAILLDPYTYEDFDEDFDEDYDEVFEEEFEDGFDGLRGPGRQPMGSLHFNGEFTLEFL